MHLIIYLVVAAFIGWVATKILHKESGLLLNIILAVAGSFLAGFLLTPILHVGTINDAITLPTMLVSLLGSIILIAIVNLIRKN
jgi:uncharacterized membrane protein YeaQ/YmgE (transglycosylase-associated protein family)